MTWLACRLLPTFKTLKLLSILNDFYLFPPTILFNLKTNWLFWCFSSHIFFRFIIFEIITKQFVFNYI